MKKWGSFKKWSGRYASSVKRTYKRHWLTLTYVFGLMALGVWVAVSANVRGWAKLDTPEELWVAASAVANVAVLGALLHGLESLRLTRLGMVQKAQREARACAIARCEEFAREIIPMNAPILNAYAAAKVPVFVTDESDAKFDPDNVSDLTRAEEWIASLPTGVYRDSLTVLNRLEAWAMYFTHGLADAKVAFGPLAPYYCSRVIQFYPILLFHRNRVEHSGRFPNAVQLHKAWLAELDDQKRGLKKGYLLQELQELQKRGTPSYRLGEPIGTQLDAL